MQSHINQDLIQQLLAESRSDDVQKLVVGAVISKDSRFLLLERIPSDFMGGLVELPSGTVEPNEDLLTALSREVLEETGLTVLSVPQYLNSFDYVSGSGRKTRQFNFLVEVRHTEIKIDPSEHKAYYFVNPSDEVFAALNVSDATKAVLMSAMQ